MHEITTFLLSVLKEIWLHARQAEDKRAMLASVAIIATVVIQATLAFVGWSRSVSSS